MVRPEGIMSLKNPVKPPGIDPGTARLVAQRLNHYATPDPQWLYIRTVILINKRQMVRDMMLLEQWLWRSLASVMWRDVTSKTKVSYEFDGAVSSSPYVHTPQYGTAGDGQMWSGCLATDLACVNISKKVQRNQVATRAHEMGDVCWVAEQQNIRPHAGFISFERHNTNWMFYRITVEKTDSFNYHLNKLKQNMHILFSQLKQFVFQYRIIYKASDSFSSNINLLSWCSGKCKNERFLAQIGSSKRQLNSSSSVPQDCETHFLHAVKIWQWKNLEAVSPSLISREYYHLLFSVFGVCVCVCVCRKYESVISSITYPVIIWHSW
jgi:hypothetical protein